MPAKTRHPVDSTLRVRQTRARRKIASLRQDAGWPMWPVRKFFEEHSLPITWWVMVSEVYNAPFSDRNIRIAELMPLEAFTNLVRNEPGVEHSILVTGTTEVVLVRPRYLKDEVL
jgi:hypothetical protein